MAVDWTKVIPWALRHQTDIKAIVAAIQALASDFPLTAADTPAAGSVILGRQSPRQVKSLIEEIDEAFPNGADQIPYDHPLMGRIFGDAFDPKLARIFGGGGAPRPVDPTTGQPVPRFTGNILKLIIQYGPQLIALWQQIAPIFSGGVKTTP